MVGVLSVIVLIAAICNLGLGLFVFLQRPSERINRLFGIFGVITSIWAFTNFMAGFQQKIFWLKSASAFGSLVPASALLWLFDLCERKITRLKTFLIYSFGLFFFIVSYVNDLIISDVKSIYLGGFEGETGPFFNFWALYMGIILSYIAYITVSAYLKAKGVKKAQLAYVLIGVVFYISIVFTVTFVLPLLGNLSFTALDSPSSLILLIFTTYAITQHRLFGIRVILTEILVGAIGIVLLIQAITAETLGWRIFGVVLLVLFIIFGYLLIQTTLQEIKRRKEIENLSEKVKISNIRLEAALKALEKLDKAKTEFLSIASHQLRTPLTAVKGYLAMLQEGLYGKFSEGALKIFQKIYASNERLIELVNSLLDISRIEVGRMEFNIEDIQIEDITESIIEELSFYIKNKNLYIKLNKPKKSLQKVRADRAKIRQVILNLVDNAIKYTQKGGITVTLRDLDDRIRISVKDTGIGMTKKEMEGLFEMYSRGKGMRLFPEGTGLGLYVAQKLLQAHMGKIWAESEGKDKGSTFHVELPLRKR
ncbi:MAG: ATP-binding protein [Candidatus Bathyarchaeota archaeon]|nr:ATP-binding protein [Candidatus Bathyarchaeota archaeon]